MMTTTLIIMLVCGFGMVGSILFGVIKDSNSAYKIAVVLGAAFIYSLSFLIAKSWGAALVLMGIGCLAAIIVAFVGLKLFNIPRKIFFKPQN